MLSNWSDAHITVNGLLFHYTRTGDGSRPPLLLLHGFSDNGLCWLPVAQALEAQYDVIMPDARGHGLSARVQPQEVIDHAADAAGLITALGLQKPVVAGHSMGGLTATELGARYPNLIAGLILEDPAWIDPPAADAPVQENPFFEWLSNLDGVALADIIAAGKTFNPTWSESEFPAWAESKLQLDRHVFTAVNIRKPWRDLITELAVPTLLITADVGKGAIVSPVLAQEAASLSPYIQVAAVSGAGHNIRRENYSPFINAVQAFLFSLKKENGG